jgi:hypothetical protein
VGDLDILVTCKKGSPVIDRFVIYEDVSKDHTGHGQPPFHHSGPSHRPDDPTAQAI